MSRKTCQTEAIQISAKNLGAIALPTFCERCYWLKLRLQHRLPFQIFPGIFSSIDSFTKRIVQYSFDVKHAAPLWLNGLGDIVECCPPPHYSKFKIHDVPNNILLTGSADGIFRRQDLSHVIVDFKTARWTNTQDELLPMYEVQLNAYARIAEACGFAPVSALYLIYMEPQTDRLTGLGRYCRTEGLSMAFDAHLVEVSLNPGLLDKMLARAREIYDTPEAPVGKAGCSDCALIDQIRDLWTRIKLAQSRC